MAPDRQRVKLNAGAATFHNPFSNPHMGQGPMAADEGLASLHMKGQSRGRDTP